ncbi:MAG TPA: crossover junction endodeoxyribonuclease RuvC [Actinomycetales bacterium]|nr:crossover junction endodeoxyribonuclease RuvC [Actinomycetales bacterium]
MRVLGIDPGLTRCGLGVVDSRSARRAQYVATAVARTGADEDLGVRLLKISDMVGQWLDEYKPDVLALERVFAQHNLTTVMGTAQVSGVVMLAAAQRKVPVVLHTPSEVKRAVTGYGSAQKAQVQTMVAKILGLAQAPKPADAADALALAICHLWRGSAALEATGAGAGKDGQPTAAQRAWLAAEATARRSRSDR